MIAPTTLILSAGGLRSLVATAMTQANVSSLKLVLLHVRDGRATAGARAAYSRRQALRYRVPEVIEFDLPPLKTLRTGGESEPSTEPALLRERILLSAVSAALERGVERIIWPAQCNADPRIAARAAEQLELLRHLVELEHPKAPPIEAPLLELSDQQLLELGGQMQVPWHMAWSCLLPGDRPCRLCAACRRRKTAFEAAGMIDEVEEPAKAPTR
jgi:7-cyano-7-deazaguanine synthase